MHSLLKKVYETRSVFMPELMEKRNSESSRDMSDFLFNFRLKLLDNWDPKENSLKYLEYSDMCSSSYGLSDDRTHGEHHKFEVLALGFELGKSFLNIKSSDELDLLIIALNEHDEGRRVAGDMDHEEKGSIMTKLRMNGMFSPEDQDLVSTAIEFHGAITVNHGNRSSKRNTAISKALFIADKFAALDPTRHTSYALKKLNKNFDWSTFERQVVYTWHRALRASYIGIKDLGLDFVNDFISAEESVELILSVEAVGKG